MSFNRREQMSSYPMKKSYGHSFVLKGIALKILRPIIVDCNQRLQVTRGLLLPQLYNK